MGLQDVYVAGIIWCNTGRLSHQKVFIHLVPTSRCYVKCKVIIFGEFDEQLLGSLFFTRIMLGLKEVLG